MVEEKQVQRTSDEIDLRDYINVIIKRKRIIITVFVVSVISSLIVSLFSKKMYQASVSIMITPSKIQSALSPTQVSLDVEKIEATGAYITPKPAISLATHKLLLKSDAVLKRVIIRLDLRSKSGRQLGSEDVSQKFTIRETKETRETNILQLEVRDEVAKKAMEIANAWAQEYTAYSQELILGEVKGAGDFITDQFSIAQKNLMERESKVKDFKDKYKLDLMRAELDIKKANLNGYKKELIDLEVALKTKQDALRQFKKEIAKQDKFIIVSKAITDDALWQETMRQKGTSTLDKKKLSSEQLNPIYQDLETRIVNAEIEINTLTPRFEYLSKSIALNELEINELEKTINQKEFDLVQLDRQVEIYKRTYDNLSRKIEEARIAKAAQLGEVRIVSPAAEPQYPTSNKLGLSIMASAVLSLILGTLLVFFMEYWQKTKVTS